MTPFEQNISDQVVGIGRSEIPKEERDVLAILYRRWKAKEGPITQRDIAAALPYLGKHLLDQGPSAETTLRKVRSIIRDLRVKRWAPVVSDGDGYFLPRSEVEAKEYIKRVEREVRSRAAASFETYRAMRESLDIASPYLDGQEKLLDLPIAGEVESASTPGKKYELFRVAGRGWICNCPSFRYRDKCRHADAAAKGAL